MAQIDHICTDGVVADDRLDFWAAHWRGAVGINTSANDEAPFTATLDTCALESIRICKIDVSSHNVERTRELISQVDHDLLKVAFQREGETCVAQGDDRVVLRPGQWMIYDMSRPYRLFNTVPVQQLALLVPRGALGGLAENTRLLSMQAFAASGDVSQMLYRCALSILDDMGSESSPVDADLGAVLLELFKITVMERSSTRIRTTTHATMQDRIKTYIRRNICSPDLTIEEIAEALGCTKRYLHKVFSDQTTISQYIWDQRLQRCGEELSRSENDRRSVTDIAFANGFNNAAHFSRVFKARFGMSPRSYRMQLIHGAP